MSRTTAQKAAREVSDCSAPMVRKRGTDAALLDDGVHLAPVVEHAGQARSLQGREIVAQHFPAVRRQQVAKGLVGHFRDAVAENGFGAGAERVDLAVPVKRDDPVRCRIENGPQLFIGHRLGVLNALLRMDDFLGGGNCLRLLQALQ